MSSEFDAFLAPEQPPAPTPSAPQEKEDFSSFLLPPQQKKALTWEDSPQYIKEQWEASPQRTKRGVQVWTGVLEGLHQTLTGLRQWAIRAAPKAVELPPSPTGEVMRIESVPGISLTDAEREKKLAELPRFTAEAKRERFAQSPPEIADSWEHGVGEIAGSVLGGGVISKLLGGSVAATGTLPGMGTRLAENVVAGGIAGGSAYADPDDKKAILENIALGAITGGVLASASEAMLGMKRYALSKYKETFESKDSMLRELTKVGEGLQDRYNVPLNPEQITGSPAAKHGVAGAKAKDELLEITRRRTQIDAYEKAVAAVKDILSPSTNPIGETKSTVGEVFSKLRSTRQTNFTTLIDKAAELTQEQQVIPIRPVMQYLSGQADVLAQNPNPNAAAMGRQLFERVLPRLEAIQSRGKISVREYQDLMGTYTEMLRDKEGYAKVLARDTLQVLRDVLEGVAGNNGFSKKTARGIKLLQAARLGYAEDSAAIDKAFIQPVRKLLKDPTSGSAETLFTKITKMPPGDLRELVTELHNLAPDSLAVIRRGVLENAHKAAVNISKKIPDRPLTDADFNIPEFLNSIPSGDRYNILFGTGKDREEVTGLIKLGARLMQYADSSSMPIPKTGEKLQRFVQSGVRVGQGDIAGQAPWIAASFAKYASPNSYVYSNHLMTPEGREALKYTFQAMQYGDVATIERAVPYLAYLMASAEVYEDQRKNFKGEE